MGVYVVRMCVCMYVCMYGVIECMHDGMHGCPHVNVMYVLRLSLFD